MNAFTSSRSAYAQHTTPARNPRSIEYDLIARTTNRLSTANDLKSNNYSEFVGALNDNLMVWSTLASDVAEPGNGLPAQLRAQLFYLYEFTADHSSKVLSGDGNIDVLIDINTAVMRGLRGNGVPK